MRIELDGGAERLKQQLSSAAEATAEAVNDAAREAAQRAPRRRGRLAQSITVRVTDTGGELVASVPYAGVIQGGWHEHNIAPQPYLPTYDAITADIEQRLKGKLNAES